MAWNSRDTSLAIQGLGSIAKAWGDYDTSKEKNKIAREALDYEKQQGINADIKTAQAQKNYDDAFAFVPMGVPKKKKKDDPLTPEVVA